MKVGEKSWRSQLASWPSRAKISYLSSSASLSSSTRCLDPRKTSSKPSRAFRPNLRWQYSSGMWAAHLGHVEQPDRVAVVAGLPVASAVGGLLLVGVEGERSVDAVGDRSGEEPLGVAVVALAQQRGRGRQSGSCRRGAGRAASRRSRRSCPPSASRRSRRRPAAPPAGRRAPPRRRSPGRGRRPPATPAARTAIPMAIQVTGLPSSSLKWRPRRSLASSGVRRRSRPARSCLRTYRPGCKGACTMGSCCKVGESGVLWRSS